MNVSLKCEGCLLEKADIEITEKGLPNCYSMKCLQCGHGWIEFISVSQFKNLMVMAIEEATFGLYFGAIFGIEKAERIIQEVQRLNAIENRMDDYLAKTQQSFMASNQQMEARRLVQYFAYGGEFPENEVIKY